MKTKLKLLALLGALSINAGAADDAASGFQGELGIGYTEDYYFRGDRITGESIQVKAKASADLKIADAFVCLFSNQGLQSTDSYRFAAGLAQSYGAVDLKIGWMHLEDKPGQARGELFGQVGLDVLLNPAVTVYQDTDDSLTTGELSLSHTFDLNVVDLTLAGSAGTTESLTGSTKYYGAGAKLSRSFGDLVATTGVDYVNADDIDSDTVFSVGIGVKF
jgi:hypothetical protein